MGEGGNGRPTKGLFQRRGKNASSYHDGPLRSWAAIAMPNSPPIVFFFSESCLSRVWSERAAVRHPRSTDGRRINRAALKRSHRALINHSRYQVFPVWQENVFAGPTDHQLSTIRYLTSVKCGCLVVLLVLLVK